MVFLFRLEEDIRVVGVSRVRLKGRVGEREKGRWGELRPTPYAGSLQLKS